jgi:D-alanyl-D-alanine dipeptidase
MTLRGAANHVLYRLGLRRVLPTEVIGGVPVVECGEPLIEIEPSSRLSVARRPMLGREGASTKLDLAARSLPEGYNLLVVDAFRSAAAQEARWRTRLEEMTKRMPGATTEEIERTARRFTAPPGKIGSGHQTGGAFDVTLTDGSGAPLDMGTDVKEATPLTPTHAHGLTSAQRSRRTILLEAMERAGFTNYPNEWWHFSFGDRMWAAYSGASRAIYGKDAGTIVSKVNSR